MKNLDRLQRPFLFALLLLIPWQWCERRVWSQAKDSNQGPATLPQLVVQLGHSGSVKHVAFSSDGRLAVTASEDKVVILWSVSTGRQIRRFEGEIEDSSVEFAPSSVTLLMSGSLWSAETGTEIFTSAGGAKFSPDGRFLLTQDSAGLKLRSALTGKEIRSLGEHKGYKSFAFSPDSRFILIRQADKSATLVNVETGQDAGHFAGDEARFSPNSAFVITNSDGTVLWNVASGKEERRVGGQAANVSLSGQLIISADAKGSVLKEISSGAEVRRFPGRFPEFSPDDRLVVTRDERGPAIFELATGRELYHFETIVDGVDGVTFSSDGRFFLTRGDGNHSDEHVSVWDARKMRASRQFDPDNTTTAVFSPDGSYVLTGDQNPVAHLWDSATGLEVRKFEGDAPFVTAVRFVKQGQFLESNTAKVLAQQGSEGSTLRTLAAAASGWEIATGQQPRYFQGLPDTVYSAGVAPDGRLVVTGGERTAHLWEVASGKEARSFRGHTAPIVSVVFSFDGRTILTASKDGTARLWEAATGRELQRFNGHADELVGAAMSKDEHVVLTGSRDGTARLWDARSGRELRQFGERKSGIVSLILCVALSPDGRFALTGNLETSNVNAQRKVEIIHSASLWDTTTGKELRRFAHPDAVFSVAFSPDSSLILTGCMDTNVRLWKLADGNLVRTLQHGTSTAMSVAFSPNGRFILTSGLDRALPDKQSLGFEACLWNAADGQLVKTFVNTKTNDLRSFLFTWAVAFSADGRSITTVTFQAKEPNAFSPRGTPESAMPGFAQLWNTDSGKELAHFGRDAGEPLSMKFSPDGSTVLVDRVEQNSMQIFDAQTGQALRTLELAPESFIFDAAYSPDGRFILAGTTGGSYLWEAKTGKLLQRFSELSSNHLEWDADVTSVRFSPDNQVVSMLVNGKVFVCDVQTGGFLKLIPAPGRELPATKIPLEMAFSPDAKFMAVVGDGGALSLINFVTGVQPLEFKGHTKKINLVAYSANENYIATASEDQTVRLWATATAKQLQVFPQTSTVDLVAFAADGRSLLTAGDRILRLWDTTTGRMLREVKQDAAVTAAALSKNGRLLTTGGKSGNIYLRNALTGAALRTLKGHTAKVTTLAFTPDSRFLVSSGDDKSVRLWDVVRGSEVPRFADQKKNITSMSLAPNGNWIVTSDEDKLVRLLDLSNGQETRRLSNLGDIVNSVAFSPDGRFILTGNSELRMSQRLAAGDRNGAELGGSARLWNLSTNKVQKRFGKEEIIHVDFSPDGKFMLTATGNILKPGIKSIEEVEIRETESGKPVRSFDLSDRDGTLSVVMSPDGRLLLTGTIPGADDNKGEPARLLGKDKGEEVEKAKFLGHSGMVMTVAFSPDGRFIVTGSLDGTIGVWNPTTGAQICRLISFSDGTWVVVDKDGRFDTNNLEEIKGLQWVMADDPLTALPLEIFMRPFYEPRLLPRLLANDDFIEAPPLADLNRVQPNVTITEVKKDGPDTAAVTVEVENVSRTYQREQNPTVQSGAKDLRLFRDGQLVSYRDGDLLDQKQSATRGCEPLPGSTKKCRTIFDHIRLPRQEGVKDVEFSAYAFNTSDVKSETFRYPFLFTPELPARKGRVYLITVGVSSYENPAWNLQFAANDAHLVHDTVTAKLRATGEYDEVVDVLLTSEEKVVNGERVLEKKATKENFKRVLRLLAGEKLGTDETKDIPNAPKILKATPEDLVLIFYSSHGYRDTERFYLFPYDTGAGAGRDPLAVVPHAISSDDLYHWLRDVDAGDLVLVIDACYAAAVTGKEFKPGPMGSRGMGQLAYDKGMRILAATQPDTTAAEVNDIGQQRKIQHGLLTYALVEDGLIEKKVSADGEGKILLSEWLEYGVKDVPALYEEIIACLRSQQCAPSSKGDGTTVRFISKGEGDSTVQQPTLFDFTRKIRRKRRLLVDKTSTH